MSKRPTQNELDTTRDVIRWFQERTQEREPQAVNAIAAFEQTLDSLPIEMREIK